MANGTSDNGCLQIGDLVLDVGQRRVTRAGIALDLPKLSFRLLQALAAAAPDMLTQDQLIEQVWPGRIVSPETLTQRVKLVRQAIGDDARAPRYIGLVRGEGYRLLVDVGRPEGSERRPALQFLVELARRNVVAVGAVYAVAAFAISRAISPITAAMPELPSWFRALFASVLIGGLPICLWLAWHRDAARRPRQAWQSAVEGRAAAALGLIAGIAAAGGLAVLIYPAASPPVNDLALLPFDNRSSDPADAYISDGVPDVLREQIGNRTDLAVVARPSSVSFRGDDIALTAIAERLDARLLVTGQVSRVDDRLRIRVELVDGATGRQLWSERYESAPDGLLALQERLYSSLVEQLMPAAETAALASRYPTDSESAISLMFIANNYFFEVLDQTVIDRDLLEDAIATYRLAVAEDRNSAIIHSRLAAALLYDLRLDEAEGHIRSAMRLDENLSHVQHTMGLYLHARHEDGVGEHFARAVELDSYNAEALGDYGLYLWTRGDIPRARKNLEDALSLDRASIGRYESLGNFYGTSGFHAAATALAEDILARFDSAEGYLAVSRIRELTGDLDEAIGWATRARARDPGLQAANWMLGELYTRINDPVTAQRYDPEPSVTKLYFSGQYEDMIDLAADRFWDDDSPLMTFALARAYTATDRNEQTVDLLTNYGLPEYLQRDSVTTSEIEAAVNLADAYSQTGRDADARSLATSLIELFTRYRAGHPDSWHPYFNLACLYSITGDRQAAMESLERMSEKRGLAWYPAVRDQPCLRKALAREPRYQAVVSAIFERTERLRARLPATLARFDNPGGD